MKCPKHWKEEMVRGECLSCKAESLVGSLADRMDKALKSNHFANTMRKHAEERKSMMERKNRK